MLWIPFNAQIICAPVNNDKKLQLWPTWNEVGHSYNNQNKNKSKTKQGLFKRFCHHLLIKVDRNGQNIANLIPSQSTKFVSSYCCNRWFYHSKLTCMPKCCLLKSGSFMFLFLLYLNKKKRTWIINPPSKVEWMFLGVCLVYFHLKLSATLFQFITWKYKFTGYSQKNMTRSVNCWLLLIFTGQHVISSLAQFTQCTWVSWSSVIFTHTTSTLNMYLSVSLCRVHESSSKVTVLGLYVFSVAWFVCSAHFESCWKVALRFVLFF